MVIREGLFLWITGPVESGKSENLISKIEETVNIYGSSRVRVFKPDTDTRSQFIESRSGRRYQAKSISDPKSILEDVQEDFFVFIDEVTLFDREILTVLSTLKEKGMTIVVAGIDLDYRGIKMPLSYNLLKLCDALQELKAPCYVCKEPGSYTQRYRKGQAVIKTEALIIPGGENPDAEGVEYHPKCKDHFINRNYLDAVIRNDFLAVEDFKVN